jgi:hypothetical protein
VTTVDQGTNDSLLSGVSVVIAADKDTAHLGRCLSSLGTQTLGTQRFEIIVVACGGNRSSIESVLQRFAFEHPEAAVNLSNTGVLATAAGKNHGLCIARYEYVTFVEPGAWVSNSYLELMHSYAGTDTVTCSAVMECHGGDPASQNALRLHQSLGEATRPGLLTDITTGAFDLAGGKLVSTLEARRFRFPEGMGADEDVVFWGRVLSGSDLRITSVDPAHNAVYVRTSPRHRASIGDELTEHSKVDRVRVIRELAQLAVAKTPITPVLRAHLNIHAERLPDAREDDETAHHRVDDEFRSSSLGDLITPQPSGIARHLVVSYAFPPDTDTSGGVMARRIWQRGEVVDVISKDLSAARVRDESLLEPCRHLLADHARIGGQSSFDSWPAINHFCVHGLRQVERWHSTKPPYESITSRTMWPAAHVLAALYKFRYPSTTWIAEFSDPMLFNSDGGRRNANVGEGWILDELRLALRATQGALPLSSNVWELVEQIAYALADGVMFTNSNQKEYMLAYHPKRTLAERARRLASVSPHPTLTPVFYQRNQDHGHWFDPQLLHVAYFGAFYPSRQLNEVWQALDALPTEVRASTRLHIFTSGHETLQAASEKRGLGDVVMCHAYVPYLDFLNITTRVDCLLINDAMSTDHHGINPYLPSKWSDYVGSGTPIWSLVEPGSPLSELTATFSSNVGDFEGACATLQALHTRKFSS